MTGRSEVLESLADLADTHDLRPAHVSALRHAAAVLKAIEAGTHKVVPVAPTDAMLEATGPVVFTSAGQQWEGDGSQSETWVIGVQRECYAAALAVAPAFRPEDAAMKESRR